MKNIKKLAAVLLAGAMTVGSAFSAFAFTDMPDDEMGVAIENAVRNGLLTGYEDNTVKPYDSITRAQMSAIIVRAFGVTEGSSDVEFSDVADTAWYKDSVEKAVYMGAFQGDENGNFNPDNNITFQETYTVLARVFQFTPRDIEVRRSVEGSVAETVAQYYKIKNQSYTTETVDGKEYVRIKGQLCLPDDQVLDAFPDKDQVAGWAADYAKAIVGNGGYTGIDGKLKPTDSVSRGEFAMIMDQLVSLYIDQAGTYTDGFGSGTVVVRAGGVTIDGLNTDKNLILSYGIDKETKVQNSTIGNCIVIYGGTDPTPVKDQNGTLLADESLIGISANMYDCRIFAPYAKVDIAWTNENPKEVFLKSYSDTASVNLGFMQ